MSVEASAGVNTSGIPVAVSTPRMASAAASARPGAPAQAATTTHTINDLLLIASPLHLSAR
jgi:hypothetical protein